MASSKEAAAQNGEQAAGKVKLEGEALKDAIKKQVCSLGAFKFLLSDALSPPPLCLSCNRHACAHCSDKRKQQDGL